MQRVGIAGDPTVMKCALLCLAQQLSLLVWSIEQSADWCFEGKQRPLLHVGDTLKTVACQAHLWTDQHRANLTSHINSGCNLSTLSVSTNYES